MFEDGAGDAVRPWELLGVKPDASESQIRAAFRKLSQYAHPDAGGTGGLYRALVKARDAMLHEADTPGDATAATRGPPQRRLDDEWLVEDEDLDSGTVDEPPQPRATSDASRKEPPARHRNERPGTTRRGVLARLAGVPSPRTPRGWLGLVLLWLVGSVPVGGIEPPWLREVVRELVFGWLPLLLIVATLARWVVQRREGRTR